MESNTRLVSTSRGVPIDAAHQAFLDQIESLANTPDAQFAAGYGDLVDLVENAFKQQEDKMEQIAFPGLHEHREQHARVLSGLHHVDTHVMKGDAKVGRAILKLFPHWFNDHLTTMDNAVAVALKEAISAPEQAL